MLESMEIGPQKLKPQDAEGFDHEILQQVVALGKARDFWPWQARAPFGTSIPFPPRTTIRCVRRRNSDTSALKHTISPYFRLL